MNRKNVVTAGIFLICMQASSATWAQAPLLTRPVQIVVPNAPGGGPDLIARLLAPKFAETFRQSVVVENRSSNNGIVGSEYGARGAPDGSVITVGNAGTHAINATLYDKLNFNFLQDIAPVAGFNPVTRDPGRI